MDHTALVLYYTRSQNTARLAKTAEAAIAECGWQVSCMSLDKIEKKFPDKMPSLIILGTPVQYWTVPAAAMEYIQHLPDLNGCPAFVYSCYGGCVANSNLALQSKLCCHKIWCFCIFSRHLHFLRPST